MNDKNLKIIWILCIVVILLVSILVLKFHFSFKNNSITKETFNTNTNTTYVEDEKEHFVENALNTNKNLTDVISYIKIYHVNDSINFLNMPTYMKFILAGFVPGNANHITNKMEQTSFSGKIVLPQKYNRIFNVYKSTRTLNVPLFKGNPIQLYINRNLEVLDFNQQKLENAITPFYNSKTIQLISDGVISIDIQSINQQMLYNILNGLYLYFEFEKIKQIMWINKQIRLIKEDIVNLKAAFHYVKKDVNDNILLCNNRSTEYEEALGECKKYYSNFRTSYNKYCTCKTNFAGFELKDSFEKMNPNDINTYREIVKQYFSRTSNKYYNDNLNQKLNKVTIGSAYEKYIHGQMLDLCNYNSEKEKKHYNKCYLINKWYAKKPANKWINYDRWTAVWLIAVLTDLNWKNLESYNNIDVKRILDHICEGDSRNISIKEILLNDAADLLNMDSESISGWNNNKQRNLYNYYMNGHIWLAGIINNQNLTLSALSKMNIDNLKQVIYQSSGRGMIIRLFKDTYWRNITYDIPFTIGNDGKKTFVSGRRRISSLRNIHNQSVYIELFNYQHRLAFKGTLGPNEGVRDFRDWGINDQDFYIKVKKI